MEMKNYLVEELSEEEEKYIICAINKAFLNSIRKYSKDKNIRKYSIDDINIQDKLPIREDVYFDENFNQYDFVDNDFVYSKKQQDICVQKLESIASDNDVEYYLKTLTYSEKLVFFLMEIQGLTVNKTSLYTSLNWRTVKRKYISAKNKIDEERCK